jgi:dihydroorotate dehydrogenase (NAD+) catalytic subunit
MKDVNLKVQIAGREFQNPVMTCSGTFGSGQEYGEFVDLNKLGAVTTKGIADVPWTGNATPRVAEITGGMLNAIGLQGPGVEAFCERDLPFLRQHSCGVIVNVCGHREEEYLRVVDRLSEEDGIDILEINISCPNVAAGGLSFGVNPEMVERITRLCKEHAKQPVMMKLTPNVTDITEIAKAAEAGGADAISLINTLTGMKIDIERRTFLLANRTGGMSGPAVKPLAVRMVYEASHAVKIPVVGMGGISNAEDAVEFMLAGATAVAVGTANFIQPDVTMQIIDGIRDYLIRHNIGDVRELIGAVR